MKKVYLLCALSIACLFSCSEDKEEIPTPPVVNPTPEPEPEPDPIVWRDYIPYSLELVKDSVWPDGKGETFVVLNTKVWASLLKDNFWLENGIYPGMVVDVNPDHILPIQPVLDVEYNPITILSLPYTGEVVTTDHPVEAICTDFKEKVLASTDQINSFAAFSSEYHSAKELYMLHAYEGLRLDSIMNGTNYTHHEMEEKNGVLYTYIYNALSIHLDMPLYNGLLKEDPADYTSLSFIHSINYGVRGCMTIESDSACASIKSVVNKVKSGDTLTEEENSLIKNSHIRTALFHSGPGGYFSDEVGDNLESAIAMIREYFHPVAIEQWVGILDISFSDYYKHGVGDVPVRIDAPVSSKE